MLSSLCASLKMQSLHLHPCDTFGRVVNLAQKVLLPTPTREVGCENNQKPDSLRGVLFLVIRFAFFFFFLMANVILTDGTKRNFYKLLKIGKPIIY